MKHRGPATLARELGVAREEARGMSKMEGVELRVWAAGLGWGMFKMYGGAVGERWCARVCVSI